MDVLQEQMAYYRARASEYDDWFYRKGRYDLGEADNAQWFSEVETVRQSLLACPAVDQALELAGGTGIWTHELTRIAAHVTSLDASAEVQAISRGKNPAANVSYRQADLFTWEPERQFDLVFFGYWLSHVPPAQLDGFFGKVNRALRPGGMVFFVDTHPARQGETRADIPGQRNIYQQRLLKDGTEFTIIKVYYEPAELQAALAANGITASVATAERFLMYGQGTKDQADTVQGRS